LHNFTLTFCLGENRKRPKSSQVVVSHLEPFTYERERETDREGEKENSNHLSNEKPFSVVEEKCHSKC